MLQLHTVHTVYYHISHVFHELSNEYEAKSRPKIKNLIT